MKFIQRRTARPMVQVKDMGVGDTFEWQGILCMKITRNGHPAIIAMVTGHDLKEKYKVSDNDEVKPVECTVCWDYKEV